MSNKSYGLGYERKRKGMLISEGYKANRCRGSFGVFDIVATKKEHFLLESVKSTKQKYYSYKDEIKRIKDYDSSPPGTIKRLVLFHRGKIKTLYEEVIHERALH